MLKSTQSPSTHYWDLVSQVNNGFLDLALVPRSREELPQRPLTSNVLTRSRGQNASSGLLVWWMDPAFKLGPILPQQGPQVKFNLVVSLGGMVTVALKSLPQTKAGKVVAGQVCQLRSNLLKCSTDMFLVKCPVVWSCPHLVLAIPPSIAMSLVIFLVAKLNYLVLSASLSTAKFLANSLVAKFNNNLVKLVVVTTITMLVTLTP